MKLILRYSAFLIGLVLLLSGAQRVLMLKWQYEDGGLITEWQDEFEQQPKNTIDVLVTGSSQAYTTFNPLLLWEKTHITSYVVGGPDQTLAAGNYMLRRALKTQSPKVVLAEMYGAVLPDKMDETRLHQIFDTQPFSIQKVKALEELKYENDSLVDLLVPMFRYHTRWEELTAVDYAYLLPQKARCLKGFEMRLRTQPVALPDRNAPAQPSELSDTSRAALDDLRTLCEQKGIQLILWKSPSGIWSRESSLMMEAYAAEYGLPYLDLCKNASEIGLDEKTDFDDIKHLNSKGASKATDYFANYLTETMRLPSETDAKIAAAWDEENDFYRQADKAAVLRQCDEIAAYLPLIQDKAYTVGMIRTGDGEGSSAAAALQKAGLDALANEACTAMLDAGVPVMVSDSVQCEEKIHGVGFALCADNNAAAQGVRIAHQNYAPPDTAGGLTIAVYDHIMEQVVDVVTFEIDTEECEALR
ncbi:MAG: hypothetical protein RR951_06910 [Ruthenibacterium sp.]